MQTAKAQQLEYNLQVLRRRDASITQILGMAGHVVLYQFNEETKAWDRRNVEGSLFVVERSSEPKNQFVVINRLSSENLVETVDANFQVELTEQFLLYRNTKQEILGVWFYSPEERTAISDLLNSLTGGADEAELEPEEEDPPPPPPAAGNGGASNVAQFFNMAAISQSEAPPMPAGAATASEVAAASAAPPPATPRYRHQRTSAKDCPRPSAQRVAAGMTAPAAENRSAYRRAAASGRL